MVLFLNTAGSFFVLLRLSTDVTEATGSGLLAGLVLSAPWLPALVLVKPLNRLLAGRPPTGLIRAAEAASLVLTLGIAAAPVSGDLLLLVAALCLMLRGFGEAVTRSSTAVLLKLTVPTERLSRSNTLAEIGKLAGTSTGALLIGLSDSSLGLRTVLVLNAATLGLSVTLTYTLPRAAAAPAPVAESRPPGLRLADPALRRLFALFLLVAFWQGFHTIAVNVVPRDVLGGGTRLVGVFVTVSAVAVFAGSFLALPVQRHLNRLPVVTCALAPLPLLLTAVLAASKVPTLVAYAGFLVLFEVAYVHYNNLVLVTAPKSEVATVATLRATLLPLGVIASTFGVGLISDLLGAVAAAASVVAVSLAVVVGTLLPATRGARPVAAPSPRPEFRSRNRGTDPHSFPEGGVDMSDDRFIELREDEEVTKW
jgi:hypothetical protein